MFRKSHISTGGERQFPVAYALINSNLQHPHPPPPPPSPPTGNWPCTVSGSGEFDSGWGNWTWFFFWGAWSFELISALSHNRLTIWVCQKSHSEPGVWQNGLLVHTKRLLEVFILGSILCRLPSLHLASKYCVFSSSVYVIILLQMSCYFYALQVKEYDSISRLDQWLTTILLRIKKGMNEEPDLT